MWQEVKRAFGFSPESQAEREKRRAAQRVELEQYAEELIYDMYVRSEAVNSLHAQEMSRTAHDSTAELHSPYAREVLFRLRDESLQGTAAFSTGLNERGAEVMLGMAQASPERIREITGNALGKALNFWQERLQEPDLTFAEVSLGRQRITEIQTRIDALIDPRQK